MEPIAAIGDGAYAPLAEINVTPMVDVMLVLLVIFMVAAPLMTAGVPVQLPKTAAQKVAQPKTPLDRLDRIGTAAFSSDRTNSRPRPSLRASAALAKESPIRSCSVRGDKAIDYGRVMTVMGEVGRAGFARVSLIAQAPGPAPPQPSAPSP